MIAVLVGNQNSGKSTIFNKLTSSNQKIGNWPGVTVKRKSGIISDLDIELVDLPGIYSLAPYSLEEKISYGFLKNEEYDLIINVVDATSLQRGLYLTHELLESYKNVIVVLNRIDKLKENGIEIDIDALKKELGVDVCAISALHGIGFIELLKLIKKHTLQKQAYKNYFNTKRNNFENESEIIVRYKRIDRVCKKCITQKKTRKVYTEFLDKIFLNRILAIPIFLFIMFGMYYLSIDIFGKIFSSGIDKAISAARDAVYNILTSFRVSVWLKSLVVDGIITGVGSVLSFLPALIVIFLFTSFLEAIGYMARVSFLFDRLLKKCGLNGKSLIPFILSTGCSVSGLLSTKIIEDESERNNTIITLPFIPCSAKLPIITLFSGYFFPNNSALIATSFYILSIIITILSAIILKKIQKIKSDELYIFELPEYSFPKIHFLFKDVKEKILEFIKKAGTTIFLVSVFAWVLLSFSTKWEYGVEIEESIMAFCGKKISWILKPVIGVDSWQAAVSAMQGIIAKEQVISSMEIISKLSEGKNGISTLFQASGPFSFFNQSSAYAFVAFNLFTTPCIAAITTMSKELKSKKMFVFALIFQFTVGALISSLIFKFC